MKSSTIAFRLQADLLEKVDADCKRLKVSRGALVRAIVEAHYESEPTALAEDMRRISSRLRLVHRNQARTLVALLMSIGKLSLEEAKHIARTDLLS